MESEFILELGKSVLAFLLPDDVVELEIKGKLDFFEERAATEAALRHLATRAGRAIQYKGEIYEPEPLQAAEDSDPWQ